MRIFIPSRGRPNKVTTLDSLPKELWDRVTLVVPRDQLGDYQRVIHGVKIEAPDIPNGIGPARQWCCDESPSKVLMLDDDLVFASRRDIIPEKFRPAEDDEIVKLIEDVEERLDVFASVGVATREGGNRDTNPYVKNTRLLRMLAYRTDIMRRHGVRFDEISVMEDFYVSLSLLTKGYENLKINYMVHNQHGSGLEGGCSSYRTPDVQASAAHKLHNKFPEFVKVVEKFTKTAWGGGTRTDVMIQWKKALASAGRIVNVRP